MSDGFMLQASGEVWVTWGVSRVEWGEMPGGVGTRLKVSAEGHKTIAKIAIIG